MCGEQRGGRAASRWHRVCGSALLNNAPHPAAAFPWVGHCRVFGFLMCLHSLEGSLKRQANMAASFKKPDLPHLHGVVLMQRERRDGGDFLPLPAHCRYLPGPHCRGGGGGGGVLRGQLTDGTWETKLVWRQRLTKRGGSDKNVSGLKLSGTWSPV